MHRGQTFPKIYFQTIKAAFVGRVDESKSRDNFDEKSKIFTVYSQKNNSAAAKMSRGLMTGNMNKLSELPEFTVFKFICSTTNLKDMQCILKARFHGC